MNQLQILNLIAQVGAGSDGNPWSGAFGFDWSEIILAIIAAGATAAGGWWKFKQTRVESVDQQKSNFYGQLVSECQSLRDLVREMQMRQTGLESTLAEVQDELKFYKNNHLAAEAKAILEHVMNLKTRPAWIHQVGAGKWYLNDAYCETFHVIRKNFWTPVNIFGMFNSIDVEKYTHNDLQVVNTGASIEVHEACRVRIMDPRCDQTINARILKSPCSINSVPYVIGELLEILPDIHSSPEPDRIEDQSDQSGNS